MLTIQPNFTTKYVQKPTAFKGHEGAYDLTEDLYNEKSDFYKKQIKDLDEVIENDKTPSTLKKFAKGAKVVSEAVLEGWAVAWGAKKGANILKGTAAKGLNSKFAKNIQDFATKAQDFIKTKGIGTKLHTAIVKGIEKFKTSKIGQNIINTFNRFADTKVGGAIIKGFKVIGNAFKTAYGFVAKQFSKVKTAMSGKSFDEVYEKTSKAAATTLGVGAGTTSAYTSVRKPEENVAKETAKEVAKENDEIDIDEDEFMEVE